MSGAVAIDRLDLRLHVEGGRLARFDLTSTRRPEAAKVLEGRPVDEALALVPLMFALCATAQGAAASAAVEAALGHRRSPRILALRRLRVDVEILADHARHLLVDAPRLVGGSVDIPGARRILGLARGLADALADPSPAPGPAPRDLARDLKEAIGTHGFAMPVERFAAIGTARHLLGWAMAAPTSPAHLLREAHVLEGLRARKAVAVPPLLAPTAPDEIKALIGMIDGAAGEAFLARPTWGRCPRATGPAVRLAGQPLVARCGADWGAGITYRLTAVLCELALLACALPARIAALEAMAEGREDGPARSSG
ncbi:hydrogenase assembly protein HupF, partial [Rhodospirillum rubrum]|uniref:hydrogenase assembly protein HupF n=1 Tax=Rhodospirillum rubrum TaxID=1085 RepID=UPI001905E83A